MSNVVTIAQIAETAGVSVPTVSKVLNGRRGVSDATRARVETLLEESGYRRRKAHTKSLVDFVISGLESQWAATLLRGAQAEASRLGVGLVVRTTGGDPVGPTMPATGLLSPGSHGIVMIVTAVKPEGWKDIQRLKCPVVLVDPVGAGPQDLVSLSATDWAGGRDACDHLIELGHRRIGFVTGPIEQECHRDRLDGYYTALRRAGIDVDPELVKHGNSLVDGGERLGRELLSMDNPPTAIISGSDEQAVGIYAAAREAGLRIPEDLSVVGFDDVDLCQWITPKLTTIHQPLAEMAAEATRMVVDLSTQKAPARQLEVTSRLVVRESTARPTR